MEPSGFEYGTRVPIQIKTRLLKECDIKEGGSARRFMAWDTISNGLKYFDAEAGEWEVSPPEADVALFGTYEVTLKNGRKVTARPVFQLLADRAAEYTPEKAAVITGVPASKIKEAARIYASKPGNGGIGYMLGVEQSANAMPNCMAIQILTGITGNTDTPGGHRGSTVSPIGSPERAPGAPPMPLSQRLKILGGDKYPMLWYVGGWADATAIWDAIHTGKPYPLKAGWAQTGNFMNQSEVMYAWEAMKKVDFFFMIDLWEVPMSSLADILLPCVHWLEQKYPRVSQGSHYALGANTGPVKPQWEARSDLTAAIQLMEKLGIPWGVEPKVYPTLEDQLDRSVEPLGMTWKEFEDKFQEEGWIDLKPLMPYRRYETGGLRSDGKPGFPQPSGLFEIWSLVFETYHPEFALPRHIEPPESPIARPDLVKDYPLTLITGRRIPVYFHSEHRQLPWCRELWPVPKMEINPETAAKLGIKQGDWVWIESPRGRIRQTADLYAGIAPNVVNAEHQWWFPEIADPGHGFQYSAVNILVDRYSQDPICGATCLRGYPVKVYKAEEGAPPGIITSPDDPRLQAWLPQYPEGGA